jgi:hypothetical protein
VKLSKGKGITGQATELIRNSAMQGAIENWITKAAQAGKISAEDFKC